MQSGCSQKVVNSHCKICLCDGSLRVLKLLALARSDGLGTSNKRGTPHTSWCALCSLESLWLTKRPADLAWAQSPVPDTAALHSGLGAALPIVWIFNVLGRSDMLNARIYACQAERCAAIAVISLCPGRWL